MSMIQYSLVYMFNMLGVHKVVVLQEIVKHE